MPSISPVRLLALTIPLMLVPLVLAAPAVPWWVDADYRECMREAADRELSGRIDLYREYDDAVVDDLKTYRRNTRTAWDVVDETQRKTFLKQVDRDFATVSQNHARVLADRLKSLKETRTDDETFCKDRQSEAKKFAASICTSSSDCSSGKICTTERGTCGLSCPYGSTHCYPTCAGTCVKP